MKIELLKDWKHEGGKVFKKGTLLDMHPSDAEKMIKSNKAKDTKQIKIKENGDDRENKRA